MIGIGDVFKTHAIGSDEKLAAVVMIADVEHRVRSPGIDSLGLSRGHRRTHLWVNRLHNCHIAVGGSNDPHLKWGAVSKVPVPRPVALHSFDYSSVAGLIEANKSAVWSQQPERCSRRCYGAVDG